MEASRAKSRSKKKGGISKLQRWLDLIAFLLHRSTPATAEEILSRIPSYALKWGSGDERSRASARREFERDKEELRAFGVAIETREAAVPVDGERYAGYRLEKRGFYLPLLCLASAGDGRDSWGRGPASGEVVIRDEEAHVAIDGLRHVAHAPGHLLGREARSALRKLTFDLDRFAFPGAPVFIAPASRAVADPIVLRRLLEAVRAGRRVRFRYTGIARNTETRRHVEPYALLFMRGRWYLAGHKRVLLLLPELARRGPEGTPTEEMARALGIDADDLMQAVGPERKPDSTHTPVPSVRAGPSAFPRTPCRRSQATLAPARGRGRSRVEIGEEECIDEALFHPWRREDPTFSFRWDPEEDVRYALMAGDPTDAAYKTRSQHGANRLAAVGLAALPLVPVKRRGVPRGVVTGGVTQRGFHSHGRHGVNPPPSRRFVRCWPIRSSETQEHCIFLESNTFSWRAAHLSASSGTSLVPTW